MLYSYYLCVVHLSTNSIIRYGSSQFCLEMVQHACQMSSNNFDCRLIHLVNRLVSFLSPAGRSALLKSHPPDKYLDLWVAINWSSFSSELHGVLQRGLSTPLSSISAQSSMLPKASVLMNLHFLCKANNHAVLRDRNDILQALIKTSSMLLTSLNNKTARDYRKHVEYLLSVTLRVLLCIVQPEQKDQHFQLMQVMKCTSDAKALAPVMLNVAEFLAGIGRGGVASSPQQPAILRVVSSLFCEIIASRSFLIQQSALRAYDVFFKCTPHGHLAASSFREENEALIRDFTERRPNKPSTPNMASYWRDQMEHLMNPPPLRDPLPRLPESAVGESMPFAAKRPRLESDEQLQFLLSNLSKVVVDVGQHCPLPSWSKDEIRERIKLLNSYL